LKDPDKRNEYDERLEDLRQDNFRFDSNFDFNDDNDRDLLNDRFYMFILKIVNQFFEQLDLFNLYFNFYLIDLDAL
jgi:hypothetical protein